MARGELPYEEAAERRTFTEWVCKTCGATFGEHESRARKCCAKDMPCECGCGARVGTGWRFTDQCRAKWEADQYAKLYAEKAVDWDGETPLYSDAADEYFFSEEDIFNYLDNHIVEEPGVTLDAIASLRLVLCKPDNGRTFDILEFLADHLPQDGEHDVSQADIDAIEKTVNEWIAAHAPYAWESTDVPVTVESVGVWFVDGEEVS